MLFPGDTSGVRGFRQGDIEGVLAMPTDDVRWTTPGPGRYTLRVLRTGNVIRSDWVHTFGLADGKILVFKDYEDGAVVVAAFTAVPH
jgi:hypothetical protein